MHLACANGKLKMAQWLRAQGVAPDVRTGDTPHWQPMHFALENGHLKMVQWLRAQGAAYDGIGFTGA